MDSTVASWRAAARSAPFALVLALGVACGHAAPDEPLAGASRGSGAFSARLVPLLEAPDAAAFRELAREQGLRLDGDGVLVDVQTRGLSADQRSAFERSGARVRHFSARHERVAASVPDAAALRALGRIASVQRIAPAWGTAGQTQ